MTNAATGTNYFELLVWLPGRGPLRNVFQGATLQEAIELAELTYGGCLVEVPPVTQGKSQLARSSTSRSVMQRLRYGRARKFTDTVVKGHKMSESVLNDQQRYDELEALYLKDGRDKLDHPMHCLYTGLYRAYLAGIAVQPADTGEV